MKKIMVLGAGTMGGGIAQAAASAGYGVFLWDMETSYVEKGLTDIKNNLEKLEAKGKTESDQTLKIISRIKGCTDFEVGKDADMVIEAVLENMEIKKKVYYELDQVIQPMAILATNTSSLSITAIASATRRPDKVIGMHFFNPVPKMQQVEVIKGIGTSEETYLATIHLAKKMGKTPVKIEEAPGFAVNRLLIPMINEAVIS